MQMINTNAAVNIMKIQSLQGIGMPQIALKNGDPSGIGFQALLMATLKAPLEPQSEETETLQEMIPQGEKSLAEEPAELPLMAGIWMTPPLVPQEEGLPQNLLTTFGQGTTIQDQNMPVMTETQQIVNPEVIGTVPTKTANPEGNQPATAAGTSSEPVMALPETDRESNPAPDHKGRANAWGHFGNPALGKASENSNLYEKSPELTEAIPQGIQQRMTSEVKPMVPEAVQQGEKPQPYAQVADKIAEAAAKGEPTALTMTLNPEELGEIEIKIDVTLGKLRIGITAENPETLNLLSGQLEKLTTRLGLQQFQIEGITLNPVAATQTQTSTSSQQSLAGALSWQMGHQMGEGRNGESHRMNNQKGSGRIRAAATAEMLDLSGRIGSSPVSPNNRLDYTI